MNFLFYLSIFVFVFLCILTCFVVLIQESKSLGLGASFGGESGESVFGTSTAEVLKKFTAYLAVIFVVMCVILSLWTASLGRGAQRIQPPTIEESQ